MSSSVRNLKIRCKVDDRPGGRNEGIDYYEGLSICMSKDPRAFDIQIRYQTTVRRELTQMLAQLERIRRHPLPTGTEPLNLPPVEPGDVIEIPTAASSGPGDLSSAAVAQEVAVAAFSPEPPRLTLPQTDTGSPEPATPEPDCPANSEPGDAEPLRPQVSPAPRSHLREAPEAARAPSQATHSTMVNKKIGFVSQSASPPPIESLLRHSR
ncbi:MAG: hypothetical protein HYZ57_13240 [Acidobacteria bacterium]|nr:hypothetical protein [Acidobacteriota bacterium]